MRHYEHGTEPFRHWIIDDYFRPCLSWEIPGQNWRGWEVSYDNDVERGKRTSRDFYNMPSRIQEAFNHLRSQETVEAWRTITEIPTLQDDPFAHGAGLHCSGDGAFLQIHLDYSLHPKITNKERRLNFILFLHPEWKPEWGGQLLLTDPVGKSKVEIDPLPGRLAVFETSAKSYHGMRQVIGAKWPRLSCAVYYLSDPVELSGRQRALFFPNRSESGIPLEVA